METFHGTINQINLELNDKYEKILSEKIQNLIKDARIKTINQQENDIRKEKIGFIERLFGKAKLQEIKLQALKLKKEEIILDEIDENSGINESINALLDYCKQHIITSAIRKFLEEYVKICDDKEIKLKIKNVIEKNNEGKKQDNLPIMYKKKSIFGIRKQIVDISNSNMKSWQIIETRKKEKRKKNQLVDEIKQENSEERISILKLAQMLKEIGNYYNYEHNLKEEERKDAIKV